jgi:hypothetical protein
MMDHTNSTFSLDTGSTLDRWYFYSILMASEHELGEELFWRSCIFFHL